MTAAGGGTFAAAGAFVIVDLGQIVDHPDGAGFADALTEHTADTAGTAFAHDRRPLLNRGTAHKKGAVKGDEPDDLFGAGVHALAASGAKPVIHHRRAADHADGMKRTGGGTAAKPDTAVGAKFVASGQFFRGNAVPGSFIDILFVGQIPARTKHHGPHPFLFGNRHTHHGADLLRHLVSAHRAGAAGRFTLHNGRGQCVTSGISASAAVITGKCFKYSLLFLIYFNFKYIAKNSQKYTYDKTDTANCCNRNYYSKSVHIICLLSCS